MSMLADRKVKQKWSLNPRGKAWSEDSNKFGQKMLEKMGWSKGKGLGPSGNGISEHIKISYKNDSKGMGYKDRNDQWTEHDANFTALLQSLSGEKPSETNVTVSSLEVKSQNSRARVHYKKFTRGKDLSHRSEKDLANIFGKRSLTEIYKIPESEDANEMKESQNDGGFAHNSGSMVDYFKKKLPNFGKTNCYVVGNNGVLMKGEESEDEERIGFGFEKKRKGDEVINGTPKKIRIEDGEEEQGLKNPAFDPMYNNIEVQKHVLNTIVEENEEIEVTAKRNKNSKKVINEDDKESGNSSSDSQKKKKKAYITDMEKKQVAAVDNFTLTENDGNNFCSQINDTFEVKRKKKKETETSSEIKNDDSHQNSSVHAEVKIMKKKQSSGVFSGILDPNYDNMKGNELNGHNSDYNVKRKKKKNENSGLENPNFENIDESENNTHNNKYEVKRKKRKKDQDSGIEKANLHNMEESQNSSHNNDYEVKRKTKKNENSGLENPNFNNMEQSQNSSHNNDYEVKRKKKKKNENSGLENPNFDNMEESENISHNNDYEVKRKKKKKNKNENSGLENPNFDNMEESQNNHHNNDYEVKRKQKKKNENSEVENPNFDNIEESQKSSHNNDYEVKRKMKKNDNSGIDNPNFDVLENSQSTCQINEYEVPRKKTKNGGNCSGIENPNFDITDTSQTSYSDSTFEIRRKKKKKKDLAIDNPSFTAPSDSQIGKCEEIEEKIEDEPCLDLVLNVTSTPSFPKLESSKQSSAKRRKSVRFSNVNEEHIIPNKDDIENRNELFNINAQVIANGLNDTNTNLELNEMSKKIDGFQAEVENDINEAKAIKFIGEVGTPAGENEKLPEGTKLKFKYASFRKSPLFTNRNTSKAKTSYKHLIKGDIILGFKNTNLHEIVGYGVKK